MKQLFLYAQLSFWLSWVFNPSQAQKNLVPNYSFEDYSFCPIFFNNPPPHPWYYATNQVPLGYYNGCSSDTNIQVPINWSSGVKNYQAAKSGQAYLFIDGMLSPNSESRGYYQVKLKDSFKQHKKVYAEFYINKVEGYKYSCNNMGLWFTNTALYADTGTFNFFPVLPANPQILNYGNPIVSDTINWVKISGVYTALGGEQYITIGNFKNDANTNYIITEPNVLRQGAGYFLDDVSVIPLDSFCLKADAGADTTITVGDSVFVGSYTNGIDTIKWYNQVGQVIDSIAPGFWVKPTTNTTYYVEQIVNGCFSRDTINVTVKPLPLTMLNVECFMLNEKQVKVKWQTANEINVSHYQIQRSTNATDFATIGQVAAKNFASNEYSFTDKFSIPLLGGVRGGLVYYRIVGIDKDGKKTYSITKSINIQHSTSKIIVFPNPAKDYINIEGKDIKEIKLINTLGQLIQKVTVKNEQTKLNVKDLSKGMYLLNIVTTKGDIVNEKIIIQ